MKRNTYANLYDPFLAWTDVACKVGEMSMASAQVIAHRTTRMATAGPMPNRRDRREFTRMGQEKIDASTDSASAIATHLTTMNLKLGMRTFRQAVSGTTALMSLAASRNIGEFVGHQAKLAETLSQSATIASELSNSTAQLARRGLKPIHVRAIANAKRLGKR